MDPHVAVEHDQFVLPGGDEAMAKLRANAPIISVSKTLIQSRLSYSVTDLFRRCCFLPLLQIACPFHSDMLFEFFTNFQTNMNFSLFTSRVFYVNIEFTKEELSQFLQVPTNGPSAYTFAHSGRPNRWTEVNKVLRGTRLASHSQIVDELLRDPRIVQHVIRNSLIPKSGDRPKITPLLSTVTYYAITGTIFDVPDLLIRYMSGIAETREPESSLHKNLALGHIIAHLLKIKYDLESPKEPDVKPVFFSNRSFVRFYNPGDPKGKKRRGGVLDEEEEEEEIHLHDTRGKASSSGTSMSLEDKVDQLSLRVDTLVEESRENWAWLKSKYDRDA